MQFCSIRKEREVCPGDEALSIIFTDVQLFGSRSVKTHPAPQSKLQTVRGIHLIPGAGVCFGCVDSCGNEPLKERSDRGSSRGACAWAEGDCQWSHRSGWGSSGWGVFASLMISALSLCVSLSAPPPIHPTPTTSQTRPCTCSDTLAHLDSIHIPVLWRWMITTIHALLWSTPKMLDFSHTHRSRLN